MKEEITQKITEIDLSEVNVSLKSNGIVYVTFKENCVLDISLQLKLLEVYHQVTNGKLTPFIFLTSADGITVTKEARDNATSLEDQSPLSASAVIVNNLAYKLIANFYMQFNKPKRPYKVFSNEIDGINWLKSLPK
jgi:hypothetical protein